MRTFVLLTCLFCTGGVKAQVFKTTGTLNQSRVNHTATLLGNGNVLVAGGLTPSGLSATAEVYDAATGTWHVTAQVLKLPRSSHTAVRLNDGKVLIVGGYTTGNIATSTAEIFDPVTESFLLTASLQNGNGGGSLFYIGNGKAVYLQRAGTRDVEIFDNTTKQWSPGTARPSGATAPTTIQLNDGRIFACGGDEFDASVEIYNPATDSWQSLVSMTQGRYSHTATALQGGKIFIASGLRSGISQNFPILTTEVYDPTILPSGSTLAGPNITGTGPGGDTPAAALTIDGKVLVTGGGYTPRFGALEKPLADAVLFDPSANTLTAVGPMNVTRLSHTMTMLNSGLVLIVGGYTDALGAMTPVAELFGSTGFPPQPGSFTLTGSLQQARSGGAALLLKTGAVLYTGGTNSGGTPLFSSEVYDPATNRFHLTQHPMLTARFLHTVSLLDDGRVLVIGGSNGSSLNTTEIFDPTTETFAAGPTMNAAHALHQAITLPGGRILVVTGNSADPTTTEIYNPQTNSFSLAAPLPMGMLDAASAALFLPNLQKVFVTVFGHVFLYDPAGNSWQTLPPLLYTRSWPMAQLLPNGKVLIFGGQSNGSSAETRSEIYDPISETSTAAGTTALGTYLHSSVVFPNGDVLALGGLVINFACYVGRTAAQLFSYQSGSWSDVSSMLTARYDFSATLLGSGAVLVAGGTEYSCPSGNTNTLSEAELWQGPGPTTGSIQVTTNLANATFTISGPTIYNGGGTAFTQNNAPIGQYLITYSAVAGYATPPSQQLTLAAGGTISFSGNYIPVSTIQVITNLAAATFTITGPATYSGNGTSFTQSGAPTGTYTISYGAVIGNIKLPNQSLTLSIGGSILFNGNYQSSAALGNATTTASGFVAEPVNTAIGNYYSSHTDLQVPGKVLAFAFTRFYNSLDAYSGPLGSGWTHSYNLNLRQTAGLVVIKETDGHEAVFTSAGGGNYVPQTAGVFDILKTNPDGSLTLTRKNQTRFNFSSIGTLLSIVDRNGNTQTLNYTGTKLTSIIDSSGRTFALAYDGNGRLVKLTDPLGRALTYGYDSSGNLVSFRDALGALTQYQYDANHRMTSATDPRGNVYLTNTFDASGRVTAQGNARGFTTTFAYNTPSSNITTVTDPLGNVTKHVHDTNLRLVQVIDALGGTTAYGYGANNLKTSTTDAFGRTQSFGYDSVENLISATDANGKLTLFAYDTIHDLIQITDKLGRVTKFACDSKGNVLSTLDAAGNASSFAYDSFGQVLTAKNARNFTTNLAYDSAGNLIQVMDALGGTVQMTYDAIGRLLTFKNQLGRVASRTYDANNRLLSVTDPLGNKTQFSYDGDGNLIQLTDANGKITHYAYDATNKLNQVTDAIGGITAYAYNGNTDLTTVTDAKGHSTIYSYDPLRRLKTTTDPLSHQKLYNYDLVGNVTSTVDGNSRTNSFAYDVLNRLVSMSLSDGKSVGYTYDAVGNRLSMTDWHGASSYDSDALNRVLSVTTPDGKTIGYGYDAIGNRTKLTYPDGKMAQYQFDGLNRLTGVTDGSGKLSAYAYDAAGNIIRTDQPNHAAGIYTYDATNRLIAVLNLAGQLPTSGFAYQLDKAGNRIARVSSAGVLDLYGYDALYRLTSWISPQNQITRYAYDAVGNRVSVVAPNGATTASTYDAGDELLTAGTNIFTYDGNGSQLTKTTSSGTVNYGWDALNRLISVTAGSFNTQYQYDGDGNRILQQIGANSYKYLNDATTALPIVLNENGPDGNIDYLYGQSLLSATSSSFQSFYQFDGLGSVVNVSNVSGNLTANYAYDPWGQATTPLLPPFGLDTLGTKNKYKFTGEVADPNAGVIFLRARYYDPSLGRFLSRDLLSAAFPLKVSPYAYANNSPVNLIDPSGLSAEPGSMSQSVDSTPPSLLGTGQSALAFYVSMVGNQGASIPLTIVNDVKLLIQIPKGTNPADTNALTVLWSNTTQLVESLLKSTAKTAFKLATVILEFASTPETANAPSSAQTLPCSSIGCPVLTEP